MSDSSVYCNLCCHLVEKRNERVLCLKKKTPGAECYRALVSIIPCYRQLMRSRRIETAVLPERQGYEPPNKIGTINSLQKT